MRRADLVRRYETHKLWIKSLPAVCCGRSPSEAIHVRLPFGWYLDKGERGGAGLKPTDRRTLPLCHDAHSWQHQHGEATFWRGLGVDPCFIAEQLWAKSGDTRAALVILREAWAIIGKQSWKCGGGRR